MYLDQIRQFFRIKSAISRGTPSELIFFATNKCNGQCKGCLYWPKLNNNKFKDLSYSEIEKIFAPLNKIRRILISGGEPYLRKDFVEICKLFDRNKVDSIYMPTNGISTKTILSQTKEILENFQGNVNVSISIDGTQEVNDNLRGKNAFKKSLGTLCGLIELKKEYLNFRVGVATRILNMNYNDVSRLALYLKKNYPIDYHYIFSVRGRLKEKNLKPPTLEQYKQYIKIQQQIPLVGIKKTIRKSYNNLIIDVLRGNVWPFECVAGKYNGVIESDGEVRLCEILEPIGNLRENNYNFLKIWNSPKADALRKTIKKGNCTRGCTHGCFLIPSFLAHPYIFLKYSLKSTR